MATTSAQSSTPATPLSGQGWTFLTNHTHVLLITWQQPDIRVREIAAQIGITERATLRIIHELVESGFLKVEKSGRENRYTVVTELPLRHPLESGHTVAELLETLANR